MLAVLVIACLLPLVAAAPSHPCFGARLRVGVPAGLAFPAYAAGYWVEEKTGIPPEFVEVGGEPAAALTAGDVDLLLVAADAPLPTGVVEREAGPLPGVGATRFWIREDVLDDLRFYTVERALGALPAFYASAAFRDAAQSGSNPKQAARQAVLRAD
jgi:hypothetical protein